PQGRDRDRQVRRQQPWFLGARIMDHRTPKRRGTRLRRGAPQGVPDLGLAGPPSAPPWAVASGGEAAIVRPLGVRGRGRPRSPYAGRRPRPGEAGRTLRRAGKWRATRATKRGTPPLSREATPPPASTTRTSSAGKGAPAGVQARRCHPASRASLRAARRRRRTRGTRTLPTAPTAATTARTMAG